MFVRKRKAPHGPTEPRKPMEPLDANMENILAQASPALRPDCGGVGGAAAFSSREAAEGQDTLGLSAEIFMRAGRRQARG